MSTLTEVQTITLDTTESAALVAAVKSVAMSACTDNARPILTGISVEIKDKQVTLAATDSYRLTVLTLLPWPELADHDLDIQFIVDAKQFVAAMPKGRGNIITLAFGHDEFAIGSIGNPTFTLPHIQGAYPEWRNLTKEKDERRVQPVEIAFNPKLLASIMKSADAFRGKLECPVRVLPALTEMKPIHMEMNVVDAGHWYSLLMPVRIP